MPITTPQGTLDFKKVDKITFVGASSNTVIDTTTGSVGIGVVGDALSSNLHVVGDTRMEGNINMLHTSNTSSIKLNSNVVTEFPRSKKLIKYPRVVLPRSAVGSSYNDYRIDRSSEHLTGSYAGVQDLFNNTATDGSDTWGGGWQGSSGSYSTSTGQHSTYVTGGTTQGTGARLASNVPNGEWVSLQLPNAIQLNHVKIRSRNNIDWKGQFPLDFEFWGSNNNGTTWSHIKSFSDIAAAGQATFSTFQVESTQVYSRIALVVTKIIGAGGYTASAGHAHFSISELHLYGVPEYDPEADGVDVVVKSVPNVPNTDWLEVYYDGQDYSTMPATVDNKTGVSAYDATPINGVGFDATYKAFTFDANSSQYLSSSTPMNGNYIHTISMWFKGTNLTPTNGDTLMWLGDNTNNKRIEIYIESDRINYNFRNNGCESNTTFENNRWYHLTCTYNGQQGSAGREIYVDGQRLSTFHSGNLADLNITNSTLNVGGFSGTSTTYMFTGSIANFRLFNRALTSDEIYQLYAYQNEYFGHGDLSMTLKAGRLGIGTSEPRAALDVQGIPHGPNSRPCWTLRATSVNSDNFAVWDQLDVDNFNGATGDTDYIIPISGYYFMQAIVIVSASGGRGTLRFYKNGTGIGANFLQDPVTTSINQNRPWNQLTGIITYYFKQGDVVKVYVDGSTYSAYNCFTGFHLGF